jgi:hypothetical protein
MDAFLSFLTERSPLIAMMLFVAGAAVFAGWWASKFYHRVARTEEKVTSLESNILIMQSEIKEVATKNEIKEEIGKLKDNDLFHISKALLLISAEVLKRNPERFERVKDTIMESTSDKRKDEIKYINVEEDKS